MRVLRFLAPLVGTLTLAFVSGPALADDQRPPGSWFNTPGDEDVDIEVEVDPDTGKTRVSGKRRKAAASESAPSERKRLRKAADEDEEVDEEEADEEVEWIEEEEEVEEEEAIEPEPPPPPKKVKVKKKKKKRSKKGTVVIVEREVENPNKPHKLKPPPPPKPPVERDRSRFRGGVSGIFGGVANDGDDFVYGSGVEGRFGVQINDEFAVYAVPSVFISERVRLAGGAIVEGVFGDVLSLGGGLEGLMVSDEHEFGDWAPGIGAQGRLGLHFGSYRPGRRKVFSMHGTMRADVHTDGTSAFTLGAMLGYDAM